MIAALLLAAACEATPSGVRQVAEGIIAADNRGDLDAIRPRYEQLFSSAKLQIDLHVDETFADGKVGYVRGRNGGTVTPKQGGQPLTLDDVFLMMLRCEAGAWRISHIIWHPASLPK